MEFFNSTNKKYNKNEINFQTPKPKKLKITF